MSTASATSFPLLTNATLKLQLKVKAIYCPSAGLGAKPPELMTLAVIVLTAKKTSLPFWGVFSLPGEKYVCRAVP
jgi:hypothetical protein